MVLEKAGKCELIVIEDMQLKNVFSKYFDKNRAGEQRKRFSFEFLGGDFSNFSEKQSREGDIN